jgi:hypothetical protein
MSKRAKEVLEAEKIEVLADKGYYNSVEIKSSSPVAGEITTKLY